MAEQRQNGRGETVEFNEDTQRWEPVDSEKEETTAPENPVPAEGEVLEDKGNAPESRTTAKEDK